MTKTYKRVTLSYDFGEEMTSEEAVDRFIDLVTDGEVLNYAVQDLPGLGKVEWIER